MKKALKITGIVVGILVLVVILLAVALPFIFNPNSFKDDIARMVKQRTGRELVIQGDIKLSLFPWVGMQIGPMELSNAQGFGSVPFASINDTDVHVAFWPLLHHEVRVGEVKLNGLNLDLEQDSEGRNNWHDISEHLAHGPARGEEEAGRNVDLSVAGVSITDSQVRWTDAQKHQQYTISDFTLKLGAFVSAKPLSVESAFDFTGTNPAIQGHLDFSGTGSADLERHLYSADDAKLDVQAQGDAVPGGQLKASLRWQHLAYNAEEASLAVNGLDAGAYGMSLHLEAQGKDIGKGASFTGSARLARFSPRDTLKALGHPGLTDTRDATAFSSAAGSFGFVAGASSAAFSNVDVTLDDTHMTGDAALKDFKTRAMGFNLVIDKLDLDRYLPPQQLGTPDRPREEIDLDKVGVPLRTLRALTANGHLHVGSFTLLGAKAGDLDVTVNSAGGLMTVKPLTANLYGGSLEADLTVDATDPDPNTEPKVSEDFTLKNLQAQGLGQDLFKATKLSGTVDLTGSLHGVGRLIGTLRRTVSGKLGFEVRGGAVDGVNVWGAIVRDYARQQGQPAPATAASRTEFSDMRGTASITRGMLNNRDFTAELPGLKLFGGGRLDLADFTLDYQLKGRVTGNIPGAGGLKGSVVPLHVSGTLGSLRVQADVPGVPKPLIVGKSGGHGG